MRSSRNLLACLAFASALLAGCTSTGPSRAERLASYQAFAGEPLNKIRYYNPLTWDELDDQYIVITMRPREQYLMRVSGLCLDGISASPVLAISSITGYVTPGLDRVSLGDSSMSCRIEEIRMIDVDAMRSAAQASGT